MRFLARSVAVALTAITPALLPAQAPAGAPPRVLLVVSGHGRDAGKTQPGYEMDELSQAYLVLKANGFAIDIASPQGGAVEADRHDPKDDFIAAFRADSVAVRQLAMTRRFGELRSSDYAAIYIMGGKGAMFDLPTDTTLQRLITDIDARGGIVATVCHGPAALAFVRRADGTPFVAGRRMTGFTDEEEAAFGKQWAARFPFPLEGKLRAVGARWEEVPLMLPHHVVDGRLITGQNPSSTVAVAEAIVRATGRTVVARTPWRDERTMAVVSRWVSGDTAGARQALAADPKAHHVELIGALGYYQSASATTPALTRLGLSIMQLAATHWNDPQLSVAIAETHWKLGEADAARRALAAVLAAHPDHKDALALRETMGK